jgi:hypothetical protein
MPDPDFGNSDGFDVPDEGLWEERFRDALARGDELQIAKILRLANNLGPSTIEALANLFEGHLRHGEAFDALYDYRLVLVARRRGRPRNLSARLVRDQQVADFVSERLSKKVPHKEVMYLAEEKFGLKKSSVTKIVAALRPKTTTRDSHGA